MYSENHQYQLLSTLIIEKFPSLQQQIADILEDVYRKFEKKFEKQSISSSKKEPILKQLTVEECQLALPTKANRKKNLGLTKAAFKNIVRQLQAGNDQLFETAFFPHVRVCTSFLMSRQKTSYEEAYDCSIDALLEIRKDLIKEKIHYENLKNYFTRRAQSKLNKKRGRSQNNIDFVDIEETEMEEERTSLDSILKKEERKIIALAIQQLCNGCRTILKKYYYEEWSLTEIATLIGKSDVATRKQATRCRDKLRERLKTYFENQ